LSTIGKMSETLLELRIGSNPVSENEQVLVNFTMEVRERCPNIRAIDGTSFISNSPSNKSKEFHTWEDNNSQATLDEGSTVLTVTESASIADSTKRISKSNVDSDSDEGPESENEEPAPIDDGLQHAKLSLKDIKTEEEILEMENKIKAIIEDSKERLANSIFLFALPEEGGPPIKDYKTAQEEKEKEIKEMISNLNKGTNNYENVILKKKLKKANQEYYEDKMQLQSEMASEATNKVLQAEKDSFETEQAAKAEERRRTADARLAEEGLDLGLPDDLADAYGKAYYSKLDSNADSKDDVPSTEEDANTRAELLKNVADILLSPPKVSAPLIGGTKPQYLSSPARPPILKILTESDKHNRSPGAKSINDSPDTKSLENKKILEMKKSVSKVSANLASAIELSSGVTRYGSKINNSTGLALVHPVGGLSTKSPEKYPLPRKEQPKSLVQYEGLYSKGGIIAEPVKQTSSVFLSEPVLDEEENCVTDEHVFLDRIVKKSTERSTAHQPSVIKSTFGGVNIVGAIDPRDNQSSRTPRSVTPRSRGQSGCRKDKNGNPYIWDQELDDVHDVVVDDDGDFDDDEVSNGRSLHEIETDLAQNSVLSAPMSGTRVLSAGGGSRGGSRGFRGDESYMFEYSRPSSRPFTPVQRINSEPRLKSPMMNVNPPTRQAQKFKIPDLARAELQALEGHASIDAERLPLRYRMGEE
jgi:hypothetical protein